MSISSSLMIDPMAGQLQAVVPKCQPRRSVASMITTPSVALYKDLASFGVSDLVLFKAVKVQYMAPESAILSVRCSINYSDTGCSIVTSLSSDMSGRSLIRRVNSLSVSQLFHA